MKKILLLSLLCATLLAASAAPADNDTSLEGLLVQLDALLDQKQEFMKSRESRINLLKDVLSKENISSEQYYQINSQLFREYEYYRFDESVECLLSNIETARALGSRYKMDETNINLAYLYVCSAQYLEAREILINAIDTTRLDRNLLPSYYIARHKLCAELSAYGKDPKIIEFAKGQGRYYASKIMKIKQGKEDDFVLEQFKATCLISQGNLDEAEQMLMTMLPNYNESSHQYAILTYWLGVICDKTDRTEDMAKWYARSAMADVRTATTDNASLCSLANVLFGMGDVMRAFRYIRTSMDDAAFYNSHLRHWQVATSMSYIEDAALALEHKRAHQRNTYMLIISILLLALAVACITLALLYRKMHRMFSLVAERNKEIERQHNELLSLNSTIIESNSIKEEYIGLFLSICSEYIDRLFDNRRDIRRKLAAGRVAEVQKELSSQDLVEEENKRFYKLFDTTFLSLYPTFVEDFNSLLLDGERITPHKGELLTTELRIFALIRLGITDSSKIASLLRYSVNTIYNYRAKVKNKAKSDRENFEERVKHIGSFRNK